MVLNPLNNINAFSPEKRNRYNELVKRWCNFNELRENQIAMMGTRVQLENMFNAEPIDIRDEMQKVLEDKKEEKENISNILVDFCLFKEWK